VYRQTDTGRQQRPRLRIASRGKNLCFLIFNWFYDIFKLFYGRDGRGRGMGQGGKGKEEGEEL